MILVAVFVAIGVLRLPLQVVLLVAIPLSLGDHDLRPAPGKSMNSDANPVATLVWTFGLMSLFAVGGANSAIPEMHRIAVDVHHWMNDKQFADIFAISQLSPGPNVLIVTLIGYSRRGQLSARWPLRLRCAGRLRCWPIMSAGYWRDRAIRAGPPSFRRHWFRFRSG